MIILILELLGAATYTCMYMYNAFAGGLINWTKVYWQTVGMQWTHHAYSIMVQYMYCDQYQESSGAYDHDWAAI